MKYSDPALTIDQQLELLKSYKLVISNEEEAKRILRVIGYFRFNNYMKHFKDGDRFASNTSIEDILALYEFDKFMRISLFEAISDIEVSIKALLNNTLACKYGTHWITKTQMFKPEFQMHHQELVNDLKDYCKNNPEEQFVKRYKLKYDDPELPPSWMLIEVLSFGTISRLYDGLLLTEDRVSISSTLRTHDNILTSWLHCLTYVRNLCAHQAKILGRTLTIRPVMPSRKKNRFLNDVEELDVSKIYSILCCVQFLLQEVNRDLNFRNNIVNLIDANPQIDPALLGFTRNWRKEQIWQG